MGDAADQVVADDERAMAKLEEQLRQERIAASHRLYDPSKPINCVDCGEIVSAERIAAYPRTHRCTPCAADVERAYRRNDPT